MIATPARPDTEIQVDSAGIDRRIDELLNRHPAVGLAVGVVSGGRMVFFRGHGVSNVEACTPITEDTVFRVASITKTFTAIAVMQLCEQGLVDLDAPVNEYLRDFDLIPAHSGFRPATLRHLLTHTSGLPEMIHLSRALRYVFGESYALDEKVPSLAEYYGRGLRLRSNPGTVFRYTDHNFAVAGQVVEDVTGIPLERYFRERIFEPLGMTRTDLGRTERVAPYIATGYTLGARGPRPVAERRWLTAAASMVYSTPRDMALYISALLGGGANEHGSVVKPATLAAMFSTQYTPDRRIPGIGLAFDRLDVGGHAVIGHEGVLPGFNSQILASPADGIGVMAFTNGARGAMLWLPYEVAGMLGHVLGVPPAAIRTDVPQRPDVWPDLCGWYPLEAPLTDMRMRAMLGAGARVSVRREELWLQVISPVPAAFRGFALHPDDPNDPYAFRIDCSAFDMGTGRVIFSRDAGVTRAHLDLLPISVTRAEAKPPRSRWFAIGAGAAAGLAFGAAVARRRSNGRTRS